MQLRKRTENQPTLGGAAYSRRRRSPVFKYLTIGIALCLVFLVVMYWETFIPKAPKRTISTFDHKNVGTQEVRNVVSSENAGALVITRGQYELTSINNETIALGYTQGGSRDPVFILTHHIDPLTNADNLWGPMYETFSSIGLFYGIDLINHGRSSPNPKNMKRFIDVEEQSQYVAQFVKHHVSSNQKTILVGKGISTEITLAVAQKIKDNLSGIILIAPDFNPGMAKGLSQVPLLLVWAKDDGVIPFSKAQAVLDYFANSDALFFDQVAASGVSTTEAHKPELIRPQEIFSSISIWVKTLNNRSV